MINEREQKEKCFEEWSKKGTDWLVRQLWVARKSVDYYRRYRGLDANEIRIDEEINRINENMAEVMIESGIRPRKLIVTYQTTNCQGCEYSHFGEDGCQDPFAYPYSCEFKTTTRTISFYGFKIDNGYLDGITSKFKDVHLDVLRVIDDVSNEIIFEYKEEGEK